MGIKSGDAWGPFSPGLDPCEQRARIRALRAISRLCLGPRGDDLDRTLRRAEDDPGVLEWAVILLNGLASLDRRRVWSSYAGLITPALNRTD